MSSVRSQSVKFKKFLRTSTKILMTIFSSSTRLRKTQRKLNLSMRISQKMHFLNPVNFNKRTTSNVRAKYKINP